MAADNRPFKWGAWIEARRRFVGYPSASAFAQAVGCTAQHVRVLQKMSQPTGMRRGLDNALCRVLRVDRKMLFTDYATVHPDLAPLVDPRPTDAADDDVRAQIVSAVKKLSGQRLRALQLVGQVLVA